MKLVLLVASTLAVAVVVGDDDDVVGNVTTTVSNDHDVSMQILRVLHKRDVEENLALNDPEAPCRNGGIYSGGICHCIHPNTGKHCEHFACVHGISVGPRYDRDSLVFGVPCMCDSGWKGQLCEYRLVDKCNNRGEWKHQRCECIGYFFGSECQYTSRCVEGKLRNGRCMCNKHFEGINCETIICYHGTQDFYNRSLNCICPNKYAGRHCNQCRQTGSKFEEYPVCTVNFHRTAISAEEIRRKRSIEMRKKVWLVTLCTSFLLGFAAVVGCVHLLHRNRNKEESERQNRIKEERHKLLTHAVHLQKIELEMQKIEEEKVEEELPRRKSVPDQLIIKEFNPKAKFKTFRSVTKESATPTQQVVEVDVHPEPQHGTSQHS